MQQIFSIFFMLVGCVAFLINGSIALSEWSMNDSRERLIFGTMNLAGAALTAVLIANTILK